MESRRFDSREVIDESYEVGGALRRFLSFPDSTTFDAEREILGSFETWTSAPAIEGTPDEGNEGKWVP